MSITTDYSLVGSLQTIKCRLSSANHQLQLNGLHAKQYQLLQFTTRHTAARWACSWRATLASADDYASYLLVAYCHSSSLARIHYVLVCEPCCVSSYRNGPSAQPPSPSRPRAAEPSNPCNSWPKLMLSPELLNKHINQHAKPVLCKES